MNLSTTEHEVAIWSFEMTSPRQLRPSSETALDIRELSQPSPSFLQFLWLSVGGPWSWGYRLNWTKEQWTKLSTDSMTRTWVAYLEGSPIGFFELHRDNHEVEITFIGLMQEFIGKGFGRHLLTRATQEAWKCGATRIWLESCNWDGPNAVNNYEARGFTKYAERTETWQVSEPFQVSVSPTSRD